MISRIKFDIAPLVNEILDQFPVEVWTSTTTTFLDPAIGGGQFVREIERRLRAAGHSDKSISERVYGCESSRLSVQYALNKFKLVGTYSVSDFLEGDFGSMKFGVVVGNPPYQSGNGERGGARSLWRKFVRKSFDVIANEGLVGMVCPGMPHQAKDIGKCFTENTIIALKNDVSHYFPNIGSDIKYWIVKEGKHDLQMMVDGEIWENGLDIDPTKDRILTSIQSKIDSFSVFECKQDSGYNSTQLKNDKNDYFDSPKGKSIYPIRHASTVKVCYVSKPTECHTKRKVMMTFSGYPAFEYYDETTPMSSCYQMSGYIEVPNKKIGKALISLYQTRLYRFLSTIETAGMKGVKNYSLPKVDLSRTWTDAELYAYFGLTQEEIDYIEAHVK